MQNLQERRPGMEPYREDVAKATMDTWTRSKVNRDEEGTVSEKVQTPATRLRKKWTQTAQCLYTGGAQDGGEDLQAEDKRASTISPATPDGSPTQQTKSSNRQR